MNITHATLLFTNPCSHYLVWNRQHETNLWLAQIYLFCIFFKLSPLAIITLPLKSEWSFPPFLCAFMLIWVNTTNLSILPAGVCQFETKEDNIWFFVCLFPNSVNVLLWHQWIAYKKKSRLSLCVCVRARAIRWLHLWSLSLSTVRLLSDSVTASDTPPFISMPVAVTAFTGGKGLVTYLTSSYCFISLWVRVGTHLCK